MDADDPDKPLVVQTSGQILHDFDTLNDWPITTSKTMLVVIVKSADIGIAKQTFDSFANNIAVDMPDRQAHTESPLLIPRF